MDWLNRHNQSPSVRIAGRDLPIAIRRHPTAKRLVMRLAPDGSEVRVTMPRWGQSRDAVEFATARTEWLARQLAGLAQPSKLEPGQTIPFRGQSMFILWDQSAARRPEIGGESIVVGGAIGGLGNRLERWLRSEALPLMESDLAEYCSRAAVPAPKLALSRAQRRWGSCSTSGTVRINWRLVMAPDLVRRSVVAHEVAHLVHFDHSPDFYQLLARIFEGELDAADRWLKKDGRSLYRYFG